MHFVRRMTLIAAMSCLSMAAHAQFQKTGDAIKYRQSVFNVLNVHTQRIGAVVKGDAPFDKASMETNAAVIELLSRQLAHAFPAGSDGSPSKAKPEVWQDPAQFKQKMDEFVSAAAKLSAATKSSDMSAIKSSFNAITQSCKACHEGFRNR